MGKAYPAEKNKRINVGVILLALVLTAALFTVCAPAAQAAGDSVEKSLEEKGTATVTLDGDLAASDIIYVNGDKTLTGPGSITGGKEYVIVINDGASLTLDGVTVNGEGGAGNGIYVSENASLTLKSGCIKNVPGHGIRVLGGASVTGGSIEDVGTNFIMVDTGAEASVTGGSFKNAGENGIIAASGSSISVKNAEIKSCGSNAIYNSGNAFIESVVFEDAANYTVYNEGMADLTNVEFTGARTLGYIDNAELGWMTITGGSMKDSKVDLVYNRGILDISGVEFDGCKGNAIENRGASADLTVKDCSFDNIGKTVILTKTGTAYAENVEIGTCGGNGIHARASEFEGKNISIKECTGIGFFVDFEADNDSSGTKDFAVDGFSIGHCGSYGIRTNGELIFKDEQTDNGLVQSARTEEDEVSEEIEEDEFADEEEFTEEEVKPAAAVLDHPTVKLSNGQVDKCENYGMYVKGGDVYTDHVTFLGCNDKERVTVQVGYSKTPGGRLTMDETYITGGKKGVTNNGTIIFNSGSIYGNNVGTGTSTGAGVYDNGNFIMNGGMITGNWCKNSGGGVTVTVDGVFTMYGGVICDNTSYGYGGGVNNLGTFIMCGGGISGNYAYKGGGGVRTKEICALYGGSIYNNSSENNGGGVYNAGTTTTAITNAIISGNTAHNGAGVYNTKFLRFSDEGAITGNVASNNGGGIYSTSAATTTIAGGIISKNTAVGGGGVYNYGGSVKISGGSITANSATNGGGVRTANASETQLGNTTVTGGVVNLNTASSGGGGYYNRGVLTFTGGTVKDNTAGTNGGGLYNYGGDAKIKGSTFKDNTAGGQGGGIYYVRYTRKDDDGNVTGYVNGSMSLSNTTVKDNTGSEEKYNNISTGTDTVTSLSDKLDIEIYKAGTATIEVTGNITPKTNAVGVYLNNYTNGYQVLSGNSKLISKNCGAFWLPGYPTYKIDTAGKLKTASTFAAGPEFTVENGFRVLMESESEEETRAYLETLNTDQLWKLRDYINGYSEKLEDGSYLDWTVRVTWFGWIDSVISAIAEENYSNLPADEEELNQFLSTLTPKELKALLNAVNRHKAEQSEIEYWKLTNLISDAPYRNYTEKGEEYLESLDTDELLALRSYILVNCGEDEAAAWEEDCDKIDRVVEKKAAQHFEELTEAAGEEDAETAYINEKLFIETLSQDELTALRNYINKLREEADKAFKEAEEAKQIAETESEEAGENADVEAPEIDEAAAAEAEAAAKAAEEAAKAAYEALEIERREYLDLVKAREGRLKYDKAKEEHSFDAEATYWLLAALETKEDALAFMSDEEVFTEENLNALISFLETLRASEDVKPEDVEGTEKVLDWASSKLATLVKAEEAPVETAAPETPTEETPEEETSTEEPAAEPETREPAPEGTDAPAEEPAPAGE